jgi:hypothetical protein
MPALSDHVPDQTGVCRECGEPFPCDWLLDEIDRDYPCPDDLLKYLMFTLGWIAKNVSDGRIRDLASNAVEQFVSRFAITRIPRPVPQPRHDGFPVNGRHLRVVQPERRRP